MTFIVALILVAGGVVAKMVHNHFRRIELVIATGSTQGEYHAMGQALAQVIPRHAPHIHIRVIETKGATENSTLVAQGKADLGFIQSDTDTQPTLRTIAALYLETFHLVARPGANLKTFGDVRGKRIVIPPPGSGAYNSFLALLRHYDMDLAAIQPVYLTGPAASQALIQGQVDAIFRVIGAGNRDMRLLLQQSRGQLVPIDQAAAIQIFYPESEPAVIPRGTYNASPPVPPNDLPTVGVRSLLITHQHTDPGLIREITRILFEYRSDLVMLNPRAAAINYPGLGIPLHPGAKAYYDRDKPSFLQENAEPIALIITLATILFSVITHLHSQIAERQKKRADLYNLELVRILEAVDKAESMQELDNARQRLLAIFRQVIEDLNQNRLSPASYQLFVFPWEMAMNTLRHREALLLSQSRRLSV